MADSRPFRFALLGEALYALGLSLVVSLSATLCVLASNPLD
jgi:hypothetical protein